MLRGPHQTDHISNCKVCTSTVIILCMRYRLPHIITRPRNAAVLWGQQIISKLALYHALLTMGNTSFINLKNRALESRVRTRQHRALLTYDSYATHIRPSTTTPVRESRSLQAKLQSTWRPEYDTYSWLEHCLWMRSKCLVAISCRSRAKSRVFRYWVT